jgi:hypothetical protein
VSEGARAWGGPAHAPELCLSATPVASAADNTVCVLLARSEHRPHRLGANRDAPRVARDPRSGRVTRSRACLGARYHGSALFDQRDAAEEARRDRGGVSTSRGTPRRGHDPGEVTRRMEPHAEPNDRPVTRLGVICGVVASGATAFWPTRILQGAVRADFELWIAIAVLGLAASAFFLRAHSPRGADGLAFQRVMRRGSRTWKRCSSKRERPVPASPSNSNSFWKPSLSW